MVLIKKTVLISILILILIAVGCEKTQEIPDKETPVEEAEKETEPNEEVQEEVTKGREIDFWDLMKEIESKKIFKKKLHNETFISVYNPSEYNIWEAKSWVADASATDLYLMPEFTIYQIVEKEKLIKTKDDLRQFAKESYKYLDSNFKFGSQNINYLEYKKNDLWKLYSFFNLSEINSEYGLIIEGININLFYLLGDIKLEYFLFEDIINCGENLIFTMSPTNEFRIGISGKRDADLVKKSFYRYIDRERNNLIEKTKKLQKICNDISFVNFEECTKDNIEKCKKYYDPNCINNDGKCDGKCTEENDNDCGFGDITIKDVKFNPKKKEPGKPIYLKEITFYNPSDYAIDMTNMTIAFFTYRTTLKGSSVKKDNDGNVVREEDRDWIEYTKDWIDDKRWLYQAELDGWWAYPTLEVPRDKGILPSKKSLTFKTDDIQYDKNFMETLLGEDRKYYKNGMIGKGMGTGNFTIRVYANFDLDRRESTIKNNEFIYTFIVES